MKINAPCGAIRSAAEEAARFCLSAPSAGVLSGVYIESGSGVSFSSTDTATYCRRILTEAEETESGRAVVPARALLSTLSDVPAASPTSLSFEDGRFRVATPKGSYRLPSLPAEDWPAPFEGIASRLCDAPCAAIVAAVSAGGYAAKEDKERPALSGVLIEIRDGKLWFASTDSHRIALAEVSGADVAEAELSVSVPPSQLKALSATLKRCGDAPCRVEKRDNLLSFSVKDGAEDFRVSLRPLADKYPNLWRFVPAPSPVAALDCRELKSALRRASVAAEEDLRAVGLKCEGKGAPCVLFADGETSQSFEEVSGESAGAFEVYAVYSYLIAAIDALGSERVEATVCEKPYMVRLDPVGRADASAMVMRMKR